MPTDPHTIVTTDRHAVATLRFLRPRDAAARTGYTRGHLLRLSRQGKFPAAVPLGEQGVAFVESEVEAWMQERLAERDRRPPVEADTGSPEPVWTMATVDPHVGADRGRPA